MAKNLSSRVRRFDIIKWRCCRVVSRLGRDGVALRGLHHLVRTTLEEHHLGFCCARMGKRTYRVPMEPKQTIHSGCRVLPNAPLA